MKNRILWKMFLLEIVTLGIYRLYYLLTTRKEMMQRNPAVKIMSPWALFAPVIMLVIAIAALMASTFYTVSSTTTQANDMQNCIDAQVQASNNGDIQTGSTSCVTPVAKSAAITTIITTLVFYIGLIVAMILFVVWLWSYSQGVALTTDGKLSFAVCLIILILVPDGIDILIVQDYFNKLGGGVAPTGPQFAQASNTPPMPPAGPMASV